MKPINFNNFLEQLRNYTTEFDIQSSIEILFPTDYPKIILTVIVDEDGDPMRINLDFYHNQTYDVQHIDFLTEVYDRYLEAAKILTQYLNTLFTEVTNSDVTGNIITFRHNNNAKETEPNLSLSISITDFSS